MFLIVYAPSLIKKRNSMAAVADILQIGHTSRMIKVLVITIDKIKLFCGGDCIWYHKHHCNIQKDIGNPVLIFLLLLSCQKNAAAFNHIPLRLLNLFLDVQPLSNFLWRRGMQSPASIAFLGVLGASIPERPKKLVFTNPVFRERSTFILIYSCSRHKKYG